VQSVKIEPAVRQAVEPEQVRVIQPATEQEFAEIAPGERILLLPHCLRPSQTCPGKPSKAGLVCPEDCTEACVIRVLREEALRQGYGGVCVAAGGKMALRFVKQNGARGILAVACDEELKMGVEAVEKLEKYRDNRPCFIVVPLLKDGCVDTEVDVDEVVAALSLRA
jgi:hypothetical protein